MNKILAVLIALVICVGSATAALIIVRNKNNKNRIDNKGNLTQSFSSDIESTVSDTESDSSNIFDATDDSQSVSESSAESSDKNASSSSATDSSSTKKDNESGWQAAYRNYMLEQVGNYNENSGNEFALIYIDSDDIPELVLKLGPGAHGYGYSVFVYKNGKVTEVQYDGNSFWYYPKHGVFAYTGSGGAFSGGTSYYKLNGTKSVVMDNCRYEYSAEYPDTPKYTINGIEVTQEEYESISKKYSSLYGKEIEFSGYPFTESSIIENCR